MEFIPGIVVSGFHTRPEKRTPRGWDEILVFIEKTKKAIPLECGLQTGKARVDSGAVGGACKARGWLSRCRVWQGHGRRGKERRKTPRKAKILTSDS